MKARVALSEFYHDRGSTSVAVSVNRGDDAACGYVLRFKGRKHRERARCFLNDLEVKISAGKRGADLVLAFDAAVLTHNPSEGDRFSLAADILREAMGDAP